MSEVSHTDPVDRLTVEVTSRVVCSDVECVDPDTGERSAAEPEDDGEVTYYACLVCGSEFGWGRSESFDSDDECQLGLPAEVRRRANAPFEAARERREASERSAGRTILPPSIPVRSDG